ncbi:MAG: hypothetical protein CL908_19940 [Deltaproteobacteria bacterium]|nr:hypothetical protein [Deltaproteobacteria bacterium]
MRSTLFMAMGGACRRTRRIPYGCGRVPFERVGEIQLDQDRTERGRVVQTPTRRQPKRKPPGGLGSRRASFEWA